MSVQIKIEKDLSDDLFSVKVSVQDITATDSSLTEAFGEPPIQVGGTITGPSDTKTLPAAERALPSGFPVLESFDGADFTDAEGLANAYATEILARITLALTTLRAKADTFTGESVTTI